MHNVLQVLASALKKVFTAQSSYINGADVDWDDVAGQVVLQCDGKLAIMTQDTFDAVAGETAIEDGLDEPIPYRLNEPVPKRLLTPAPAIIRSYAHVATKDGVAEPAE